jgi:ubiquinone/menaquinone biosynthesis C-methylase UbiE
MVPVKPFDNFYDKIKPRLYQRVGRELRSANYVLDIGCGNCELAGYLSETYGQKVTGIDISSESFPDKRKMSKDWPLVKCIRRSASKLDFIQNETIDAVVMFWSLHEINDPKTVLQQAYHVLKPGGKLLVVEFPHNSLAQKLWNEKYFSKQQLMGYLDEAGFENIQARLIENKQILWASGHSYAKKAKKSEQVKVKVCET